MLRATLPDFSARQLEAVLALVEYGSFVAAAARARAHGKPIVLVPAALCLVLQMRWTEPFYLRVPGAVYIQFPWRLLGLLTPAVIAPPK